MLCGRSLTGYLLFWYREIVVASRVRQVVAIDRSIIQGKRCVGLQGGRFKQVIATDRWQGLFSGARTRDSRAIFKILALKFFGARAILAPFSKFAQHKFMEREIVFT